MSALVPRWVSDGRVNHAHLGGSAVACRAEAARWESGRGGVDCLRCRAWELTCVVPGTWDAARRLLAGLRAEYPEVHSGVQPPPALIRREE